MAPTNPDQITAQRKLIDAQRLLTTANKKALKQKSQQNPQVQNQSYEPEGEVVDEARRSEKEGKGSPESPLSIREERFKKKGVIRGAAIGKVVEKVEVQQKEVERNRINILKLSV